MSVVINNSIDVINRFTEEFQPGGNEAVADELLAADFVDHKPFPGFGRTRDDVIDLFRTMRGAFPDLRCEVEEQITMVIASLRARRSAALAEEHSPESTPRFVASEIKVIDIIRISDGKFKSTGMWSISRA